MIYLLDTDILIFMARGSKRGQRRTFQRQALRLIERCQQRQAAADVVGLSAITISELEFGARCGGRYAEEMSLIQGLTAPFQRFDFDAVVCPLHYGEIRDALDRLGKPMGALDILIAAHALALDATLVTNNEEHFGRVPQLRIEDWLSR